MIGQRGRNVSSPATGGGRCEHDHRNDPLPMPQEVGGENLRRVLRAQSPGRCRAADGRGFDAVALLGVRFAERRLLARRLAPDDATDPAGFHP